jgi:acyl carrier protein
MVMTQDEIFARVSAVLQDSFEIDAERIRPEARLYEDLDIDSIDAVDLLVKLKPMLDKPLRPEQFKSVRTIQDVVQALALLIDSDSPATA